MRKPACSIMALTAPVRLRAVASGLMIENVRSIDICDFRCSEVAGIFSIAAAYSVERIQRQGGLRGLAAWTGCVDWLRGFGPAGSTRSLEQAPPRCHMPVRPPKQCDQNEYSPSQRTPHN